MEWEPVQCEWPQCKKFCTNEHTLFFCLGQADTYSTTLGYFIHECLTLSLLPCQLSKSFFFYFIKHACLNTMSVKNLQLNES